MDETVIKLLKEKPKQVSKAQSMYMLCEVLSKVCYDLAKTNCVLEKRTERCSSCGKIHYKKTKVNAFVENGDIFKKFSSFWKAQVEPEKRRIEKYGKK